ncbi:hypothetical protein EYF80_004803 [Liparis tanakae]|uniref:Uncharacterized protein n=1 Tax=Liparis tanakae TaxID=230148 RepID=A0A4Z2J4Z4_9TELE|nr:hypothetical protein EYF80_004803 [Liparis tanakae]
MSHISPHPAGNLFLVTPRDPALTRDLLDCGSPLISATVLEGRGRGGGMRRKEWDKVKMKEKQRGTLI